jgi:Putative peptidoglycan binding domain
MNIKSLILPILAVAFAASVSLAQMPRSAGFAQPQGGTVNRATVAPSNGHPVGGTWNGARGDWRHHDFDRGRDRFFFAGSFGFPFWGLGYPYGYSYYPYGYYPGGYYGYGYGYYPPAYPGYYSGGGYGYGYGNQSDGYGYRSNVSQVVQLQRRLKAAGYYRGALDGIMGPRTRSALRAYQRDRGMADYGQPTPPPY